MIFEEDDESFQERKTHMEAAGAEMAAHAILQTLRSPADWRSFDQREGGPTAFANRIFPAHRGFSDDARRAFIAFFEARRAAIRRLH